ASLMAPGSKHHSKAPKSSYDVRSNSAIFTRSQSSALNSPQVNGMNMPTLFNTSVGGQSQLGNNLGKANSTSNTNHPTIDGDACEGLAQVHSNSSCALVDGDTPPKIRDMHKRTMGHGLDKINERQGTRMAIFVPAGKIRPENPVQAAKLASECGVALRDHLPIYPHWKDYKKVHKNDNNEGGTAKNIDHISKVLGVVV
ncbi:hypothetical protein E2562_011228, partial [Oryza meyeriana var. granulata]